ncbi:MAG: sigma-70 family RNA polymerase sigma factor [Deferribacteres bacterium]|nr:sigma-70 family RNA polymerase sigma factor [candidate division KSB1 bacterium]MCB9502735.1 sigma-70 family RNA polymerase sigma factor [Deferribacteres bacterium]
MYAQNITQMLIDYGVGNKAIVDQLLPLVYDNLQRIAHQQLRRERANHTINTTALVHEAYIKLIDQHRVDWKNRAHFYAIASQAMRRILINYAQARLAEKRGGGEPVFTFNEAFHNPKPRLAELVHLDESLNQLAKLNERQAKVVELSFFGGLSHEEIAEVLHISVPSVRRDWRLAKAWLTRELKS